MVIQITDRIVKRIIFIKSGPRSVSDADIRKYEMFSQTLQQSRGFGSDFRLVPKKITYFKDSEISSFALTHRL